MPMWRCPHCGTPQAETARCWVCRRSSTACATCRHFRRSVAAQLGYCGLDRVRHPLHGDEIRACWEAASEPAVIATGATKPVPGPETSTPARTPVRILDFVEVGAAQGPDLRAPQRAATRTDDVAATATAVKTDLMAGPPEARWSLWGDADL